MEFQQLGEKERKVLLTALDISIKDLKCELCGDPISYKRCSIMPPLKKKNRATILCECILCLATYLEEIGE